MINGKYTVRFSPGHLERDFELPYKGYARDVLVEASDGRTWLLYFTDLARLQQDLGDAQSQGVSHFAERNLIVLAEVTVNNIRQAIDRLWGTGFFDERRAPHAQMIGRDL